MQQQEDHLRRLQEEVRLFESQPARPSRTFASAPASPRNDADGARWGRGAATGGGTGAQPIDLAAAAASRATGLIAAAGGPDADYPKQQVQQAMAIARMGSHAQHATAASKAAESSGAGSPEQVKLESLLGDVRSLLQQVINSSSTSLAVGSGSAGGSVPRQHLLRPAQAVIQLAGGSGPGQHRAAQQIHLGDDDSGGRGTAWYRMRHHDDALGHHRERWRTWFACFGV